MIDLGWLAFCILLGKCWVTEGSINNAKQSLYWPLMRFVNVIILRWRLIMVVTVISLFLAVFCAILTPQLYSYTCALVLECSSGNSAVYYLGKT